MSADHVSSTAFRQRKTPRLIAAVGEALDIGWRREHARAELIRDFWFNQGHRVSVRVEPVFVHHSTTIWGVRSDLLGALPTPASISQVSHRKVGK